MPTLDHGAGDGAHECRDRRLGSMLGGGDMHAKNDQLRHQPNRSEQLEVERQFDPFPVVLDRVPLGRAWATR